MATADNFTIEGDKLGGLHELLIEAENPIDYLGNQRGLTGPVRLSAKRFADVPTIRLVKAYLGNNGISTPVNQVELDVNDNHGKRVYRLTLYNATVIDWNMTSPEQPGPQPDGQQPEMKPDLEGFVLVSTHGVYQSGGGSETYRRRDPAQD